MRRVLWLVAGLVLVGAAVFVLIPAKQVATYPDPASTPFLWLVFVAGFLVAELMVFHIEIRRDAITLSLSEVPLAFALLFLSPVAAISARVVGIALRKAPTIRTAPHKFALNVALVFCETALAIELLRLGNGTVLWQSSLGWLVFMIAIAASSAFSAVMVAVAISLFSGGNGLSHLGDLGLHLYHPATASIAVFSVLPAVLDPSLVWLALAPISAMWLVIRAHGNLTQRHRDLIAVSSFAQTLNSSPHFEEVLPLATDHARELLRAELAVCAIRQWDNTLAIYHASAESADPAIDTLLSNINWERVFEAQEPTVANKADGSWWMQTSDRIVGHDGLVLPLRSADTAHGALVVVDRAGVGSRFVDADLGRGAAISRELCASVSNGHLHQEIAYQANHDSGTGLPNLHHVEQLIDRQLHSGAGLAVLIAHFPEVEKVREALGTEAGDQLLLAIAERVNEVVDDTFTLARIQVASLAIVLPRAGRDEAAKFRTDLHGIVRDAFVLDGLHVVTSPTCGTALAPTHGTTAADLLRCASVAVATAREGLRAHCTYSTDIDHHSESQLELLANLRSAIDDETVDVHFQPQTNIATGIVEGAEALIRWTHPERGPISPEEFVPAAEETTLISEITDLVVRKSLEAMERLEAAGHPLAISVNISATDLLDDQFPARIARALAGTSTDPGLLTLEVTETSIIHDASAAQATLRRLRSLGVRISVDDFGTGYASLSYLRELTPHEVKLDRSFVGGVLFDDDDAHIVSAMIDLAHNLGVTVVAEGVENDQMLQWLRSAGCDLGQGYGICRPLNLDHLVRWLNDRSVEAASLVPFGPTT